VVLCIDRCSSTEAAPICYQFCLGGQILISERGILKGPGCVLRGLQQVTGIGKVQGRGGRAGTVCGRVWVYVEDIPRCV